MPNVLTDPILVLDAVVTVLDDLALSYFITGSFASGVHGEFRATNDIDIVCKLSSDKLPTFIERLSGDFFVDDIAIRTAVQEQRSFNIIHKETILKVDFFTRIGAIQDSQLKRATSEEIPGATRPYRIGTAEDIILSKLSWYRLGGEVSERQWRDVQTMIRIKRGQLDDAYLRQSAEAMNVGDLLKRALS